MVLSKTDMQIGAAYSTLVQDRTVRERIWNAIHVEWERTRRPIAKWSAPRRWKTTRRWRARSATASPYLDHSITCRSS